MQIVRQGRQYVESLDICFEAIADTCGNGNYERLMKEAKNCRGKFVDLLYEAIKTRCYKTIPFKTVDKAVIDLWVEMAAGRADFKGKCSTLNGLEECFNVIADCCDSYDYEHLAKQAKYCRSKFVDLLYDKIAKESLANPNIKIVEKSLLNLWVGSTVGVINFTA